MSTRYEKIIKHVKSRGIPYQKLTDEEVKQFLMAGWRVKSPRIYVKGD